MGEVRGCLLQQGPSWKSKGGLSKGGLGPKGANWAKKGLFGAISALPPWLWGAEELVPIGPEKAPTSPEMAPICPEKARFSRKDVPPIFSENLGLKPPFVSPPLDFPKRSQKPTTSLGRLRLPTTSCKGRSQRRPLSQGDTERVGRRGSNSFRTSPDLPFLAFRQGKPPKKQGFSVSSEPQNPWKRKGELKEKLKGNN